MRPPTPGTQPAADQDRLAGEDVDRMATDANAGRDVDGHGRAGRRRRRRCSTPRTASATRSRCRAPARGPTARAAPPGGTRRRCRPSSSRAGSRRWRRAARTRARRCARHPRRAPNRARRRRVRRRYDAIAAGSAAAAGAGEASAWPAAIAAAEAGIPIISAPTPSRVRRDLCMANSGLKARTSFDLDRTPTGLADGLATTASALRALTRRALRPRPARWCRAKSIRPGQACVRLAMGPPFALVPDEDDSAGQSISRPG